MLHELGIDPFYVLVNTRRGVIAPEYPPGLNFDHVILAIPLPADLPTTALFAVVSHPRYGKLLLFDPTSTLTPLGYLPSVEQANYGMLAAVDGGELIRMPLLSPTVNRLWRTAHLTVAANGSIAGTVDEVRMGDPAEETRARLLAEQGSDRAKVIESFLGPFMDGFTLTKANVQNLDVYDKSFILSYQFAAPSYAQTAGDLLILRPRILGGERQPDARRKGAQISG